MEMIRCCLMRELTGMCMAMRRREGRRGQQEVCMMILAGRKYACHMTG